MNDYPLSGKGRETRTLACGCTDVWYDGKFLGRGPNKHTGDHSAPMPQSVVEQPEVIAVTTRVFATGATRDVDQSKLDFEGFLSPRVLRIYAEYMHECRLRNIPPGQTIRSSDNWQRGIPKDAYMKSLVRHVMEAWEQHRNGKVDQKVLTAIMFNVMGYLFEETKLPEPQLEL